jgi:hypothetical protein
MRCSLSSNMRLSFNNGYRVATHAGFVEVITIDGLPPILAFGNASAPDVTQF